MCPLLLQVYKHLNPTKAEEWTKLMIVKKDFFFGQVVPINDWIINYNYFNNYLCVQQITRTLSLVGTTCHAIFTCFFLGSLNA